MLLEIVVDIILKIYSVSPIFRLRDKTLILALLGKGFADVIVFTNINKGTLSDCL